MLPLYENSKKIMKNLMNAMAFKQINMVLLA